jgi:hypothetical protein
MNPAAEFEWTPKSLREFKPPAERSVLALVKISQFLPPYPKLIRPLAILQTGCRKVKGTTKGTAMSIGKPPPVKLDTFQGPLEFAALEYRKSPEFSGPVKSIADKFPNNPQLPPYNPLLEADLTVRMHKALGQMLATDPELWRLFKARALEKDMLLRIEKRIAADEAHVISKEELARVISTWREDHVVHKMIMSRFFTNIAFLKRKLASTSLTDIRFELMREFGEPRFYAGPAGKQNHLAKQNAYVTAAYHATTLSQSKDSDIQIIGNNVLKIRIDDINFRLDQAEQAERYRNVVLLQPVQKAEVAPSVAPVQDLSKLKKA